MNTLVSVLDKRKGVNNTGVDSLSRLVDRASELFDSRFGHEPTIFTSAPGRVNLIGEHTDYNNGFVFPAAIDKRIVVAASASQGPSVVWSDGYDTRAEFSVSQESEMKGWTRFPSGMAWIIERAGHSINTEVEAIVVSDLPTGAGVSSSAAMEMAFAMLWNEMDSLGISNKNLALLGQSCEHRFIGVQCGVMDQMASALGKEDHAMFLDTRSLERSYAPIPPDLNIVLCDTGRQRTLAGSAYNERRAQCEQACRDLGVKSLRDATLDSIDGTYHQGVTVQLKRARHVLSENQRCLAFAEALSKNDRKGIGRLMRESHVSLRDDYEVSCEELDAMAEAAWKAPGCAGARMTGAGFGGACVALVEKDRTDAFKKATEAAFRQTTDGSNPSFITCRATYGANVLNL